MKNNSTIKVIDFSSNRDLGKISIESLLDVMTINRSLEYLGLSKLNLTTEMVIPIFDMIGSISIPWRLSRKSIKRTKSKRCNNRKK